MTYSISIHAPARGATVTEMYNKHEIMIFLSTLPRGERRLQGAMSALAEEFLSTLPRGERQMED